jgi:hypothetical protein
VGAVKRFRTSPGSDPSRYEPEPLTFPDYAVLTVWFAFFGGSLHSPVTTFFYMQLDATNTDIGWIGSYMDIGSLVAVGFCPPFSEHPGTSRGTHNG